MTYAEAAVVIGNMSRIKDKLTVLDVSFEEFETAKQLFDSVNAEMNLVAEACEIGFLEK